MSAIKKRFIAGARCPQCQEMDSIYVYKKNGIEQVACMSCDYHEQQVKATDDKAEAQQLIGIFKP